MRASMAFPKSLVSNALPRPFSTVSLSSSSSSPPIPSSSFSLSRPPSSRLYPPISLPRSKTVRAQILAPSKPISSVYSDFCGSISALGVGSSRSALLERGRGDKRGEFKHRSRRERGVVSMTYVDDDDDANDLIDAPVSLGDGFSFSGGKYSDEEGETGVWRERGKFVESYGGRSAADGEVREPVFGLKMGQNSQVSGKGFRWFYVEDGDEAREKIVLLHGLPSQSYSFRNVIPHLERDFHVFSPDWLGFGLSDKPQPGESFSYSSHDYSLALASLLTSLSLDRVTLVAQGYFSPAVVEFASNNPEKIERIILINPPVLESHSRLPSALSSFSNFLLGEIFSQDPLRASDKLLGECAQYIIDEKDLMVYRFPYLSSGMAGFALNGITRSLNKNLNGDLSRMRNILASSEWTKKVSIIWGKKDRWLKFDGLPEFARSNNISLYELPEVGHHAQEDFGEEVGKLVHKISRKAT